MMLSAAISERNVTRAGAVSEAAQAKRNTVKTRMIAEKVKSRTNRAIRPANVRDFQSTKKNPTIGTISKDRITWLGAAAQRAFSRSGTLRRFRRSGSSRNQDLGMKSIRNPRAM